MDVNILAQVGFVVLVGLAAKNAILIVEFARQAEEEGKNRIDAAVQAARTRLSKPGSIQLGRASGPRQNLRR